MKLKHLKENRMAELQHLVIHCAATPPRLKLTPGHIRQWHMKERGWSRVGYSDLIDRTGKLHNLTPFNQDQFVDDNEMTWGVRGINGISRHLCLEGGTKDEGGYESPLHQHVLIRASLKTYLKYTILRHPKVKISGHSHWDTGKPFCPGFNVEDYLDFIGINRDNIL
jgi:hypothetical protein